MAKFGKIKSDNFILAIGIIVFIVLLFQANPSPHYLSENYSFSTMSNNIKFSGSLLKLKTGLGDFAQDVVGFRALYFNREAYPILGKAFKDIGIEWDVQHVSTHPPTAYLFAAPIAFLPLKYMGATWNLLTIILIYFLCKIYGFSWKASLGLTPIAIAWTPIAWSGAQITLIWLVGLACAYRFRKSKLILSGASVGMASLTKFFPALGIAIFTIRKEWKALIGFILIWAIALTLIQSMNSSAIFQFINANIYHNNSIDTINRVDNGSFFIHAYQILGISGVLMVFLFLASILYLNREALTKGKSDSLRTWMLVSYFSVALLPIAWVYSLAPVLPLIYYFLSKKNLLLSALAVIVFIIPIYCGPFTDSKNYISIILLLLGFGFIVDRPSKKIHWRFQNVMTNI